MWGFIGGPDGVPDVEVAFYSRTRVGCESARDEALHYPLIQHSLPRECQPFAVLPESAGGDVFWMFSAEEGLPLAALGANYRRVCQQMRAERWDPKLPPIGECQPVVIKRLTD